MTITPLDLAAWGAIYCGVTLVRSNMSSSPRAENRFGGARKRALTGYFLIIAGAAVLLAVLLRHFVHLR